VKFFRDFYGDYVEDPIRHVRFMKSIRSMLPEEDLFEIFGNGFVAMHERAAERAGKPRWADKAPENVVFLDRWQQLLGDDWLFVHVVRNPLDTLASIAEMGFPVSVPPDLGSRIELYLRYTSAGIEFGEANPERYVRVLYEDLVEAPEATVRAMMEGLGEDLAREQLTFGDVKHQKGLEDPKVTRTTEVHDRSVGRWQSDLASRDAELIADRALPIWRRAGGGAVPS